jgi:DNA-binding response OmpR family regulator
MLGRIAYALALVELGLTSVVFRRALAKALSGLSVPRADSLDAAFVLAERVVLLVAEGADPIAPIQRCARELRAQVLVACEHAEGCEVGRWARAGVNNCFVGPESLEELYAAVRAGAPSDSLDVRLDANDLAIEVAGARTRLTRTQFRLLQHLRANTGRWVTARELVKEALGTHHEDGSALVRVHIHAIRRALGPRALLIETDPARARGYRLRTDLVPGLFSAEAVPPARG